jgi:antirestriction protein ArdC
VAPFGSPVYSSEELVAELGAAFLCAVGGIEQRTLDNSAAYVAAWLARLREEPRLVVIAAAQAQKAADSIIGSAPPASDSRLPARRRGRFKEPSGVPVVVSAGRLPLKH